MSGTAVKDAEEKGEVLAVHFGRSASCSSIGSVVDVLFVSGVVGTALLAALAVMLGRDDAPKNEAPKPEEKKDGDAGES
jgi:hypothetical protein